METPYKGVTWTYDMLLLESLEEGSSVNIYHATQFDSPYLAKEWIDKRRRSVKRWEMKARLYGIHSDQEGKPYYEDHMELLVNWSTRITKGFPIVQFTPTNDTNDYRELCKYPVTVAIKQKDDERNTWIQYEKVDRNTAYFLTADTAEGCEDDEQQAADRNCGFVFRKPSSDRNEDPRFPVMVAACRSTRETMYFARNCIYAAIYYNCCLLAPEIRGESAGVFKNEVHTYPHLYTMTVMNDRINKPTRKVGYVTSVATRQAIFDGPADFLATFEDATVPKIQYKPLIKELMSCIVGKKGRPDHPKKGTTDSIVAFGIGIYVWQFDELQIKNNRFESSAHDSKLEDWYAKRRNERLDKNNGKRVFKGRR